MKSLGMIETRGLIPAIEACDTMLKTANVELIGKRKVSAGLVTILIEGDIGAVKAAITAGASAATKVCPNALISAHAIPRPMQGLDKVLKSDATPVSTLEKGGVTSEEKKDKVSEVGESDTFSEKIEQLSDKEEVVEEVLEEAENLELKEILNLSVIELRKKAREYEDFPITGRAIAKANKKTLVNNFKKYFKAH